MTPRRTIEHQASRTAAYTCFSRACANREQDPRLRGPDDMAWVLLPVFAKCIASVPFLRRFFMGQVASPGIYEYVLARTKLLDEIFVQALENDFAQIVLLGAGFDTRALRFASQSRGTKVFELDVATTQQPKIDILNRKGITLPEELSFVPIDFNRDSLLEVLTAAGYQEKQRSLFIWEGVTMYLDPEAVDSTLLFIRDSAPADSRVVFDYIYASVLRRENRYYGEAEICETVSRAGESWTFGLEEGQVEGFLAERGFEIVAHYAPGDLEQAYLTAEDGTRFGRINGTHCIVVASVCEKVKWFSW
jgi:methyltransferase (TIGR00027 family)